MVGDLPNSSRRAAAAWPQARPPRGRWAASAPAHSCKWRDLRAEPRQPPAGPPAGGSVGRGLAASTPLLTPAEPGSATPGALDVTGVPLATCPAAAGSFLAPPSLAQSGGRERSLIRRGPAHPGRLEQPSSCSPPPTPVRPGTAPPGGSLGCPQTPVPSRELSPALPQPHPGLPSANLSLRLRVHHCGGWGKLGWSPPAPQTPPFH